uniref:Uncharacterized protein n=1 Tax=Arundo donax TaxID=35708 RepID=A0A0A9B9M5_ARUDO
MRGIDNKCRRDAAPLTLFGVQERLRELGEVSRLFLLVDKPSGVSMDSFDGTKCWGKTSIRP